MTNAKDRNSNADWWPNQLNLKSLTQGAAHDPMGDDFDYGAEFEKLDLKEVKKFIETTLTTSQEWWPADFGHYGGLMIRLAWHSAGTYRSRDGRGGAASGIIRLAPVNSWPDNANLDKARRLLWPVKKKYGRALSWADLMILTGNVALESMGFETIGFGGGRADIFEPQEIDWGPEKEWMGSERFDGEVGSKKEELKGDLAASHMGLIYVNPEGPGGVPDPLAAAHHIRATFARMDMNDEETVALIAGGHTLGKMHGAANPDKHVGAEPEAAPIEKQGLGWANDFESGKGEHTITSGLEGAWTNTPNKWSHDFLDHLFNYEWELTKSPAGAHQWAPKGMDEKRVPDAHVAGKMQYPVMLTTDLSLRFDPIYEPIARRFHQDPEAFKRIYAEAWYKLTHRDMGPHARLRGSEVPEPRLFQDPVPTPDHALIDDADASSLKAEINASGLSVAELVSTAWASAASYRHSDKRGGANGARVRLAPMKDWEVNNPTQLAKVIGVLEGIQQKFNASASGGKQVSLADLIVLAGAAGIEQAAKADGHDLSVPFNAGRGDATQEMTDVTSFNFLEPKADAFRNYVSAEESASPTHLLIDRASQLNLSAPEMAVLLAGMRVMGCNFDGSDHGVFTQKAGSLGNDFFVNLLDSPVEWREADGQAGLYQAHRLSDDEVVSSATAVDLVFGSNSQLRAIAEVYASDDAKQAFVEDFVAAWHKVMNLDRFDRS